MKSYLFIKFAIPLLGCIFMSIAVNAQTSGKNSAFKKHTLSTQFKSEGVATADVNKDGKMDVIAGPEWFEAPGWKIHKIYESKAYNPAKEYSTSFLNFTLDVNLDSWEDLIVVGFPGDPGYWYENPKNREGYWKKHAFLPEVGIGNESPAFVDMDGDGRLDIVCADSKANQLVWLQAPVNKNDTTWHRYVISKKDPAHHKFSHGIGSGDLNKDGRKDIFTKFGWWEAPSNPKQFTWNFYPGTISEDCSQMHVMDVNSDGLTDVISASAHKLGIWWHQQNKDANGKITFTTRELSNLFTQSHASSLADINGDGNSDLISGKRFFAHNDSNVDPGTHDPAVLYWFEYTPGKTPYFTPHLVDNNSGAGLQIVATDLNEDKRTDIIIANKKGVFYFENKMKRKAKSGKPKPKPEAIQLFDGKTFNGWEGDTMNTWRIRDGALVGGSLTRKVPHNEFISTTKNYSNYSLKLKFKLTGTVGFINGGVQFHSQRISNPPFEMVGYQADLGKGYWASLYDESRRNKLLATADMEKVKQLLRADEWNDYEIRTEGRRIRIFLNGEQTVDYMEYDLTIPQSGLIALQIHGGGQAEVHYKDLMLQQLP